MSNSELPKGWRECKLGDVAEICSSKRIFAKEYVELGIPFYRSKEIIEKELGVEIKNPLYISAARFKEIKEIYGSPKDGDILLSAVGERSGIPYLVANDGDFYFKDGNLIWLKNFNIATTSDFLYYWFKSEIGQSYLMNSMIGSAQKALTIQGVRGLEINLPPLTEQKAIAEVLSSLDDKIDLLHQQNQTLEDMAQTLFREWFIEKADEGWEEVKIKDFDVVVTDYVANGSFASLKQNVTLINDIPSYALFIRNTDLKSNFNKKVYVDKHSYEFLSKTKLHGGEIIISSVGDVGSVFRCPYFNMPMTLGNNVIMLNSKYNLFFYLFFSSSYGQYLIDGITSGSVQQKFNKTSFRNLFIKYESIEQLDSFENLIKTYFDKIDSNTEQIKTLEQTRDTLLPKLMSGQVRV
ncbi:restriction endonuclease subunit S [Francisella salimarina]|uniref:restriction endonuclease subunit S n=1 Tax=Francisella salimarina TaxID=2599927 RepID=UPI003751E101